MSFQLAIYLAAAASIALGYTAALYFWFLPALLAMPVLRAYLITEHTGCSQDQNGLSNTRTTLTVFPIRLIMWNMPYHAEHHLFPAVPFHQPARAACADRRPVRACRAGLHRDQSRRSCAPSKNQPIISKCASVVLRSAPLIGTMSCGQAENATMQSISARKVT
jgi:hypothetical protein